MEKAWGANRKGMSFEYMVPSSWWTQDSGSHCLVIDLPGFKKDEVRLRADKYGHVIVSGERLVNDGKIVHFEQSYKVPVNSNVEEAGAVFEEEIFYVTIPKKVAPEKEVSEVHNSTFAGGEDQNIASDDGIDKNANDEEERTREGADECIESNMLEKIFKQLKKNRTIVLTAVVAFSLGVVLSQHYHVERSH